MNYKYKVGVIVAVGVAVLGAIDAWAKRDFFVRHEVKCAQMDSQCIEIKTGAPLNGMLKTYFPSGKVDAEINYANGVRDGKYRLYYESGALRSSGVYQNGKINGNLTSYYEDGTLQAETQVSDGLWDGTRRTYYHDGTLKSEEEFSQGLKNGEQKFYFEDGNPSMRVVYDMGNPVSGYCLKRKGPRIDFTANIETFKNTGKTPCDKDVLE